jgi:signal transduction histidine kinase
MTKTGSPMRERLATLLRDDVFLPPTHQLPPRTIVSIVLLLIVLGLTQGAKLASPIGILFFLIYLVGGLGGMYLQYVADERRFRLVHTLTLAVVAVLAIGQLPEAALIVLQLVLFQTFTRPAFHVAVVLAIIPTALYVLVARGFVQLTAHAGSPVTLLLVIGLYAFDIFGGLARRYQNITNQHLNWTREQLDREIARNAHLAVAQDRARIARDMHDILAHSLTLLSVQNQAARQTLATDPTKTARLLDEMAVTLRQSIQESRDLVQVLREAAAPEADKTSLLATIQTLADSFGERTGVQIAITQTGEPHPLPDGQMSDLRYIVQEALTNAFRHGAARHVNINLAWQPDQLKMQVLDDGTPQSTPLVAGTGNGLRGMRERLSTWDGVLSTAPRASGGYAVELCLPVQPTARESER